MAKMMRKVLALCMMLALCIGMMAVPAFADNGNGTGQTQIHIHLDGNIGDNKDSVTIIVDGKEYHGSIQGSKLKIEMNTTDNGFDFAQGESMDVNFVNNNNGSTGTLTLTHKEGNGNNIDKEHDKGLNNFNGSVKPEETEPEATEPEATEPEATEPEATEPEATEPEATEPEATEPEATEPEATEPEATEPEATEPEATEPEATEPKATEPKKTEPKKPTKTPRTPVVVNSEIEISDEDVPLASAPKTGDISTLWIALSGVSAAGMILLGKKKEEDEA